MSFLSKFRKKEVKLQTRLDLGALGTDMHSHLIPGIDDGVKTLDESLELIRHFAALGYTRLVTTPHIMTDYYKNTPEIIRAGLADLRLAIKGEGIAVEVDAAAEYMVDIGFREKFEKGELMTFGNKYLLIEISYLNPPHDLSSIIFDLRLEGYHVILAHPERYGYWHGEFSVFEDLINRGVHLQLNMISLAGFYGDEVMRFARQLVDREMFSFAGSDMHNMDYMQSLEASAIEPYLEKLIDSGKLLNSHI